MRVKVDVRMLLRKLGLDTTNRVVACAVSRVLVMTREDIKGIYKIGWM